nr:G protein-coupled receptor [Proales similis]
MMMLNATSESHAHESFESWLKRALALVYAIIFILGLMTNLAVICFVMFYKRMQTATNKFIMNLAVSDLLVVIICIPVTASHTIHSQWILGEFLCRFSSFVQGVSLSVSVMTLTAVSLDRYVIIYKPLQARSTCTNFKVRLVLVLIWALSFFIMFPLLLVFKFEQKSLRFEYFNLTHVFQVCIEQWPYIEAKIFFEIILTFVLFIFPLSFMCYAYTRVTQILWFSGNLNNRPVVSLIPQTSPFIMESNQSTGFGDRYFSNGTDRRRSLELCRTGSQALRSARSLEPLNDSASKNQILKPSIRTHSRLKTNKGRKKRVKFEAVRAVPSMDAESFCSQTAAVNRLIKSRRRVVKLLIVLVILFALSWLPFHIITFVVDFLILMDEKNHQLEINELNSFIVRYIHPLTLCLALANSLTNPVCFMTLNQSFRSMMCSAFRRVRFGLFKS